MSIHYFSCSINILKLSELLKLFCYALGHFLRFSLQTSIEDNDNFQNASWDSCKNMKLQNKILHLLHFFFTVQQYDFEKWNETWNYYCTPCVPRQSEPVKIIDNQKKKNKQHITSLFKITIGENLPKDMNLVSETFERISDSILIFVCLLLLLFRCVGLL